MIVAFNYKNITRIYKEFNRSIYRFDNFFALPEKEFVAEKFSAGLTIYRTKGHCWNTLHPALEVYPVAKCKKKYGYYFIHK